MTTSTRRAALGALFSASALTLPAVAIAAAAPPDADAEILALRAEFVRLNDIYQPLNDAANEEAYAFRLKYEEVGWDWEAACAWSNATARYWGKVDVEQMGVQLSKIVERMLDLKPKTLARIVATVATLKEDHLDHLWDEPEDERDWDILMLTRLHQN